MTSTALTAETYITSKALVENLKQDAVELSKFYEGDIKIEINMSRKSDIVKVNVIEYNL